MRVYAVVCKSKKSKVRLFYSAPESLPNLGFFSFFKFKLIYMAPKVVTSEALDNVCEQLVQGRTRQCSGWD